MATLAHSRSTEGSLTASYRFGDTEIDTARREIRRGGTAVDVQPRVFDLIVYLVGHRDRVVGRDELLDHVWGTRFVAASTVNGRIRAARGVLGDTGEDQHLIRTLHGRGYRFVADVESIDPSDAVTETPARRVAPHPAPPPVGDAAPVGAAQAAAGPTDTAPTGMAPTGAVPTGAVPIATASTGSHADTHEWPLVGRIDLIDSIEALFAGGAIGGVVLAGVDGVGTTRTATAAADRLAGLGARVVAVRGLDGAADVPLSALAHLLDTAVLESSHTAPDLARADVMHKAVASIRSSATAGGRLVVVIDDVHHMDALSLAVIASLVDTRSVFAIVAARRTAVAGPGTFDSLVHAGSLRCLVIEPLSTIQLDVLLYRALQGPIDADSLRAFAAASGGRPGHLRELVSVARATGMLQFEGGVWRLAGPVSSRLTLEWPPPTLSEHAVRAAEVIAIAGEVSVDLLSGLCDEAAIDELDGRRLLTVTSVGGEPLVSLSDPALTAQVVESIGVLRRRRLRRHIAERLLGAAPDDAAALATVLDCVERHDVDLDVDRAHVCEIARRAFAGGCIERALRLVDRMAGWDEPDVVVLRAEAAAHRSQWELADSLLAGSDVDQLDPPWLTAAITLGADLDFFQHARHEHAIDTLDRHADTRDDEVARAADRRLWLLAERGDVTTLAAKLADDPASTVRPTPERVLAAAVEALLTGRFGEALGLVDTVRDSTADTAARHSDAALSLQCLTLRELGRVDEAREIARSALGLNVSHGLGMLPIVGAMLELESGYPRAARVLLGSLADSGHVRRHPYLTPIVAGTAGVVEIELGNVDAGRRLFDIAERDLDRSPTRASWLLRLAMAAAVLGGDDDLALRHAGMVADEARRRGATVPEAQALAVIDAAGRRSWAGFDVAERFDELTERFEGPRWRDARDGARERRPNRARELRTPSS